MRKSDTPVDGHPVVGSKFEMVKQREVTPAEKKLGLAKARDLGYCMTEEQIAGYSDVVVKLTHIFVDFDPFILQHSNYNGETQQEVIKLNDKGLYLVIVQPQLAQISTTGKKVRAATLVEE